MCIRDSPTKWYIIRISHSYIIAIGGGIEISTAGATPGYGSTLSTEAGAVHIGRLAMGNLLISGTLAYQIQVWEL